MLTLNRSFIVGIDDRLKDAVPTHKLEWISPKISLMGTGKTAGNKALDATQTRPTSKLAPS